MTSERTFAEVSIFGVLTHAALYVVSLTHKTVHAVVFWIMPQPRERCKPAALKLTLAFLKTRRIILGHALPCILFITLLRFAIIAVSGVESKL